MLDALGRPPVLLAGYGTGALVALHLAASAPEAQAVTVVAPTSDRPLLAAAPDHALADVLAATSVPVVVLDPQHDPLAGPGAVAASCAAAGAHVTHDPVDDWHRLAPTTRRRLVEHLAAQAAVSAVAATRGPT